MAYGNMYLFVICIFVILSLFSSQTNQQIEMMMTFQNVVD